MLPRGLRAAGMRRAASLNAPENAAMLCVQVAWLVPMVPLWRWNAGLRWNPKYFLGGLFVACGLFFGFTLVQHAYDAYASPWSWPVVANILFVGLSVGFTAGLFGLKAPSMPRALAYGAISLVAQIAVLLLALVVFWSPGAY